MIDVPASTQGARGAAQAAAALALAGGFLGWSLATGAGDMADVEEALPRFAAALAVAAAVALAACVLAARAGRLPAAGRAGWAAALVYLAALKAAGFAAAPWLAVALVPAAWVLAPARVTPALPWLHVMGTMAGLHVALTAERYAAAMAAFPRAMAGLAALLP